MRPFRCEVEGVTVEPMAFYARSAAQAAELMAMRQMVDAEPKGREEALRVGVRSYERGRFLDAVERFGVAVHWHPLAYAKRIA